MLCATGVLFAGRADGLVEAWDLLDRTHEPVLVSAASTVAITRFCITPDALTPVGSKRAPTQQLLAVGEKHPPHSCLLSAFLIKSPAALFLG